MVILVACGGESGENDIGVEVLCRAVIVVAREWGLKMHIGTETINIQT